MKEFRRQALFVHIGIVAIVVLSLLLTAQAVLAGYLESVTVGPFRVNLVSKTDDRPMAGWSTWTYQIYGDDIDNRIALSHWLLETNCPVPTGTYTTTEGAVYSMYVGDDGSTGYRGTKWDYLSGTLALSRLGGPHTFTFEVPSLLETTMNVVVKYGNADAVAEITGPYCAPTSVNLTSLEGSSSSQMPIWLTTLALSATIATISLLSKASERA